MGSQLTRRALAAVLCIPVGLITVGCSRSEVVTTKIMATTGIWADVISATTCAKVPVAPVIPGGGDGHDFEMSMRGADRMLRADLIFTNGAGLDAQLEPMLERARESGVEVVDLSRALPQRLKVLPDDPHFWMDPERVEWVVAVIAEAVGRLELMDRGELNRCAEDFADELDRLTTDMTATMADIPSGKRQLVSEHRNLGHFAQRFDLQVLGVMSESPGSLAEIDPQHLERLRRTMGQAGVDTVFVDKGESSRSAETFVQDLSPNGRAVPLYIEHLPGGTQRRSSYVTMMRLNAERVSLALR